MLAKHATSALSVRLSVPRSVVCELRLTPNCCKGYGVKKKKTNIKRRTKYNLLLLLCRDIAVDCALRRGRGWGGLRACRIIWVLERKRLLIRTFPFCLHIPLRYLLTSRVWTTRGIPSWSRERRYNILRKSLFGKVANVFTNSVAGLKYGKRNTAAKTPFLASVVYFFMLLWRFRPF